MVGHNNQTLILALIKQILPLIGDRGSLVFIKDTEHRYIDCNRNYSQLLGLDKKQIIGATDQMLNPQHQDLYLDDDNRVLCGESLDIANPANFAGLGMVTVAGKIVPLKNEYNQVTGILGTTRLIYSIANQPFAQTLAILNAHTIPLIVNRSWYEINTRYGKIRISRREAQCILFLLKSYTAEDIAKALDLSARSIESYFVNIKNKLNVHHKSDILELVITGGLFEQI